MKGKSIVFYGIGWYLMIPPMLNPSNYTPNTHAPLNTWTQIDSYQSVNHCKSDKELKSLLADKNASRELGEINKLSTNTKDYKTKFHLIHSLWDFDETMFVRLSAALCISSDDPRLKQ